MKTPQWIEVRDCLVFHDVLVERFGGLAGLRDEGLLDSALNRPRHMFAYGSRNHYEMAAAYAEGIIRNHPFADGNKRMGFLVAALFLELNGHSFHASEEEVVVKTLGLAVRAMSEAAFAKWLEANCA